DQRNPMQNPAQDRSQQRRDQGNQQSDLGNSTDRSLSEDEPFNSDDYADRTEGGGSRSGGIDQNQQSGRRDQKTDR
ncbi:MAG: hypothetical protein ABW069_02505, partial [Duganella sp.]